MLFLVKLKWKLARRCSPANYLENPSNFATWRIFSPSFCWFCQLCRQKTTTSLWIWRRRERGWEKSESPCLPLINRGCVLHRGWGRGGKGGGVEAAPLHFAFTWAGWYVSGVTIREPLNLLINSEKRRKLTYCDLGPRASWKSDDVSSRQFSSKWEMLTHPRQPSHIPRDSSPFTCPRGLSPSCCPSCTWF